MNDVNKICSEWTGVSKTPLTFIPKFLGWGVNCI